MFKDVPMDPAMMKKKSYNHIGTIIISGGMTFLYYYYLYKVEVENQCYSISTDNIPYPTQKDANYHSVSSDFHIMLSMLFYLSLIDTVREILIFIYLQTAIRGFLMPAKVLNLTHIVSFAAWIMMQVYRLRHSGRVCSGSYSTDQQITDS